MKKMAGFVLFEVMCCVLLIALFLPRYIKIDQYISEQEHDMLVLF